MPRKQVSEFHKQLQGDAPETLMNISVRTAIVSVCEVFRLEYPSLEPWERLCGIRDHVNAMIAAYRDLNQIREQRILAEIRDGRYKDNPKGGLAALEELKKSSFIIIQDIYGEVDRQGIPEY